MTTTRGLPFSRIATEQIEAQGREIVVEFIGSTNPDLKTTTPDQLLSSIFAFDARTDEQKTFVGALLVAEVAHGGQFGDRSPNSAFRAAIPKAVTNWLQKSTEFRSGGWRPESPIGAS